MKFITIGELLMRLSPPDYEKIRTTSSYVVNFGGAEANVAVSLANLGVDTTVFTVLPDNDIGRSAVRSLKANDVHTSPIIFGGERMGVYFLEEGIGVRSSKEFMTVNILPLQNMTILQLTLRLCLKAMTGFT